MADKRIRAVAILLKDNKILLIHRTREGKEFWVFPGGGVERNEKMEDAVIREVEEEASIKAEIVKLLYTHEYPDTSQEQYFFLCRYVSGTAKLGNFNELQTMKNEDQTYDPKWEKINKIKDILLYPLEIKDWIIEDAKNDFKDTPRTATLSTSDLRQQL